MTTTTETIEQATEAELKEQLLRNIERIHDMKILRGMASMAEQFAADVKEEIYELTPEEEKMIDEALADESWISDEEATKETHELLRKLCRNSI